jgi:hypothetical protein
VGDALTPRQLAECKELGILVDKDDQGILLQIFTKPLGGWVWREEVMHHPVYTSCRAYCSRSSPSH